MVLAEGGSWGLCRGLHGQSGSTRSRGTPPGVSRRRRGWGLNRLLIRGGRNGGHNLCDSLLLLTPGKGWEMRHHSGGAFQAPWLGTIYGVACSERGLRLRLGRDSRGDWLMLRGGCWLRGGGGGSGTAASNSSSPSSSQTPSSSSS